MGTGAEEDEQDWDDCPARMDVRGCEGVSEPEGTFARMGLDLLMVDFALFGGVRSRLL